jgi:hypothetical protein
MSVSSSTKSALGSLLRGVAWLLFLIGVLSFWVGGRAINEFGKTERILAEMEGIGIAAVCAALGALTKGAGDRLAGAKEVETSTSESELKSGFR